MSSRVGTFERVVPAVTAAWIAAEVALITALSVRLGSSRASQAALIADVALVTGGALWLLRQRGVLDVRRMLQAALVGALVFAALSKVIGLEVPAALLAVIAVAELGAAALVLRTLVRFAREGAVARWDEAERRLTEVLPAAAARVLTTELRLLAGAFAWMLQRPVRVEDGTFTSLRKSQSGFLLPALILLSGVEMLALHAGVAALWWGQTWVHAAIFAVHAYGVLWFAGDRRAMQESGHRIRGGTLELALGMRFRASIPIASITHAWVLRSEAERREARAPNGGKSIAVTPFDAPNLHLCVRSPQTGRTYFGIARTFEHLDLYVDEPEAFLDALKKAHRDTCPQDRG